MSRPTRSPDAHQRGRTTTARIALTAALSGFLVTSAVAPASAISGAITAEEPGDIFDWWDKEKKPGLDKWLEDGGKELVGDTPLTPDMGKKPDAPEAPKDPAKPDPGNADPKKPDPIPPPEKPDAKPDKKPANPDLGLGGLFSGLLNTVISLIGGLFGIGN